MAENGLVRVERVAALLYTLMRDDVPVGRINKLVNDLSGFRLFDLSDPDLAAIAQRHAETLMEPLPPPGTLLGVDFKGKETGG